MGSLGLVGFILVLFMDEASTRKRISKGAVTLNSFLHLSHSLSFSLFSFSFSSHKMLIPFAIICRFVWGRVSRTPPLPCAYSSTQCSLQPSPQSRPSQSLSLMMFVTPILCLGRVSCMRFLIVFFVVPQNFSESGYVTKSAACLFFVAIGVFCGLSLFALRVARLCMDVDDPKLMVVRYAADNSSLPPPPPIKCQTRHTTLTPLPHQLRVCCHRVCHDAPPCLLSPAVCGRPRCSRRRLFAGDFVGRRGVLYAPPSSGQGQKSTTIQVDRG